MIAARFYALWAVYFEFMFYFEIDTKDVGAEVFLADLICGYLERNTDARHSERLSQL